MAAERMLMSPVDVAWLRMDRPTNLMMIIGVWVLERPVGYARFRKVIAERFMRFERFRYRPVDDGVTASWELDPDFDLDAHIRQVALPAPAGQAELEALVSDLAGLKLDPRRPLWQFQLVENYAGGAAVVMRIHHCYADGIAHLRVFLDLTDGGTPPGPRPPGRTGAPRRREPGHAGSALDWIGHLPVPGADLAQRAVHEGIEWITRAAGLARHPGQANELAREALGMIGELAHLLALEDDPPTRFRGRLGQRKRAAWADPLPFHEVHTAAHALGCTVNDILMAAAAGALGSWLRDAGEDTDGLVVRAAVPVNLRDPALGAQLGNRFGLVYLDLPVGIRNPLTRTWAVHEAMARLKGSYQPVLTLGLMATLGLLGRTLEDTAVDLLAGKASLVASNVPGPQEPRYLAGRRLTQLMFWVPQSGDIGVGISILTYDGQVQFGLIADSKRIPDPRAVVTRFATEFEQLLLAILMGPFLARRP